MFFFVVSMLCVLETTMPLAKALFSESSSLGPLAGDIAHPSSLGNLGCYILLQSRCLFRCRHTGPCRPLLQCKAGRLFLPGKCHSSAVHLLISRDVLVTSGACRGVGGFLPGDMEEKRQCGCLPGQLAPWYKPFYGSSKDIYTTVKRYQSTAMLSLTFIITSFVALC